jgi:hypothetical protein
VREKRREKIRRGRKGKKKINKGNDKKEKGIVDFSSSHPLFTTREAILSNVFPKIISNSPKNQLHQHNHSHSHTYAKCTRKRLANSFSWLCKVDKMVKCP